MDSTVRYVIDINLNGEADGGSPTTPDKKQNGNKTKPKKEKEPIELAVGLQIAKTAKDYATSRVEMFTGSNSAQTYVNNNLKLIGYTMAIAANPILGSVALGLDLATSTADYLYSLKMETVQLEQQKRLLGALSYGRSR